MLFADNVALLVGVCVGVGFGLAASSPSLSPTQKRLVLAAAFGVGLFFVHRGHPFMWVGLLVVAASVDIPGLPPRWRGAVVATAGLGFTMFAARNDLAPAVIVPGMTAFAVLVLGARTSTGSSLPHLVLALSAISQFGLYAALPDTEAAIGLGSVAAGLALVGWRPGIDAPLVLAIATVMVPVMLGSIRDTSVALQALPALGMLAIVATPGLGAQIERRLEVRRRWQLLAVALHLGACAVPRFLIVGSW